MSLNLFFYLAPGLKFIGVLFLFFFLVRFTWQISPPVGTESLGPTLRLSLARFAIGAAHNFLLVGVFFFET